jgi:Fic family protein
MIENLSSGAKSIALAELGETDKRNAVEIVGNVHAMQAAIELADSLDEEAILAMHSALVAEHAPDIAGRWRQQQVWIGGSSYGPHEATFIPPHQSRVPAAMADLMEFVRRDDVPVLVQAAIAHAQFETIHPFPDGNGRTGRVLIHSMLRRKDLTRNVTVPIAAGLLVDTNAYFAALTAYRAGDVGSIVTRVAEASFEAIANARRLVAAINEIRERWETAVKARRGTASWRIAGLATRQPVFDAETVARELGMFEQNVGRAIEPLVAAGVLSEFTGRRRNRIWQAREIIVALDDFAARAGRRVGGTQ